MKLHKYQIETIAKEIRDQIWDEYNAKVAAVKATPEYKNFEKTPEAKAAVKEAADVFRTTEKFKKKYGVSVRSYSYSTSKHFKDVVVRQLREEKFITPIKRADTSVPKITHMIALRSIVNEDVNQLIADVKKQVTEG